MLYEVSASPKPGLVDRFSNGAHKDMDFFTFMSSSASLSHFFSHCALKGEKHLNSDLPNLFSSLRPAGISAEKKMFFATGNINTHKGIIFSIGTICAAAGYLFAKDGKRKINAEKICDTVMQMTAGLSDSELGDQIKEKELTAGEKLFRQYGLKGIRGEVESGFLTVRKTGLKELRKIAQNREISLNDKLLHLLISLMTETVDSNIIGRHNPETLAFVKQSSRKIMKDGGVFDSEFINKLNRLDLEFTAKNISPGGSADLLAVTALLGMIEGIEL